MTSSDAETDSKPIIIYYLFYYRDMFWFADRKQGETYTIYASRLQSLLGYYLSSRDAKTLEAMKNIIVADKIKASLPLSILKEVNNRESLKFL